MNNKDMFKKNKNKNLYENTNQIKKFQEGLKNINKGNDKSKNIK